MRTAIIIAASAALLAGCEEKKDAPSTPSAPQASPPATQPAPGGGDPHAGLSIPTGGAPVTGVLELGSEVAKGSVKAEDTLFIMARQSQGGGRAGGLVAVKRMSGLTAASFPARFELGQGDVMVQGTAFRGPFIVYARLDRDGDPMTRTDEDLYATVADPVDNGAQDLKLVLKPGEPKTLPAPPAPAQPAAPSSKPSSRPSGH